MYDDAVVEDLLQKVLFQRVRASDEKYNAIQYPVVGNVVR